MADLSDNFQRSAFQNSRELDVECFLWDGQPARLEICRNGNSVCFNLLPWEARRIEWLLKK